MTKTSKQRGVPGGKVGGKPSNGQGGAGKGGKHGAGKPRGEDVFELTAELSGKQGGSGKGGKHGGAGKGGKQGGVGTGGKGRSMNARQENWWGEGAFPGLPPEQSKMMDVAIKGLVGDCKTEEEKNKMWLGGQEAKVLLVEILKEQKRNGGAVQKAKEEDGELTVDKRASTVDAPQTASIASAEQAEAETKADAVNHDAANISP